MHILNILSLNVNGLNSAVKRTRVLEYLHRKSISFALIQETHLKQSDVARFKNKYYKLAAFEKVHNTICSKHVTSFIWRAIKKTHKIVAYSL